METTFNQLGIENILITAINEEGITTPTQIQEKTIPFVLAHRDVVGQSETGSGKTLAYVLPLIQKVDVQKKEAQVLILTPTHELAVQIHRVIVGLTKSANLSVSAALIIGNVNIARQIEKLKDKPQILVGSSGRILELINKKKINPQTIKTIVLDEADRLLDENNNQTVKALIKTTLKDRQLLLFSATFSPAILQKLSDLLKNPEVIRVSRQVKVASTITHLYFKADQRDKFEVLKKLIQSINPSRALIFINKSEELERTVEKLKYHGLEVEGIHGSSVKMDRRKAMEDFKAGKINLMVASDLAARGLDIKGITHIFNLDMPEDPQIYLHRAGRTGRAGETGMAISIVSPKDMVYLKKIENAFGITITLKEMFMGKIVEPIKRTGINRGNKKEEKTVAKARPRERLKKKK